MKRIVIVVLLVLIAVFAGAAFVAMRSETHAGAFVQELFHPKDEKESVCSRPKAAYDELQKKCGKNYSAVFESDGEGQCDRFVGCARVMY